MTAAQSLICLVAAALLLLEVTVAGSRSGFLLAALPTAAVALVLVHQIARRRGEGHGALLYAVGVLGAVAGYCYLALSPAAAISPRDEVIEWGRMDKRPLVFGYLGIGAFIAFHWLWVAFLRGVPPAVRPPAAVAAPGWPARVLGAVAIAVLAYG